jgi:hypothetical protein
MASSAQWMSSNTRTVGSVSATVSNVRQAAKSSSRSALELASTPTSGRGALAQPIAVGPADGVIDLGRGDLGIVGLEDAGLGLHDLAQRPECDSIAVREAAALAPGQGGRVGLSVGEKLGDDPTLADAGLADDGDQLNGARCDALVKEALEQTQVDLSTDVRAAIGPNQIDPKMGTGRPSVEDPDRFGLAL